MSRSFLYIASKPSYRQQEDQRTTGGIQLVDKSDQAQSKRVQKHEEFHGNDLLCLWRACTS